jgi:hypothetical protein
MRMWMCRLPGMCEEAHRWIPLRERLHLTRPYHYQAVKIADEWSSAYSEAVVSCTAVRNSRLQGGKPRGPIRWSIGRRERRCR